MLPRCLQNTCFLFHFNCRSWIFASFFKKALMERNAFNSCVLTRFLFHHSRGEASPVSVQISPIPGRSLISPRWVMCPSTHLTQFSASWLTQPGSGATLLGIHTWCFSGIEQGNFIKENIGKWIKIKWSKHHPLDYCLWNTKHWISNLFSDAVAVTCVAVLNLLFSSCSGSCELFLQLDITTLKSSDRVFYIFNLCLWLAGIVSFKWKQNKCLFWWICYKN